MRHIFPMHCILWAHFKCVGNALFNEMAVIVSWISKSNLCRGSRFYVLGFHPEFSLLWYMLNLFELVD